MSDLVLDCCEVHGRAAEDVLAEQQRGPPGLQQRLHDCQVAAHDSMVQRRAPLAVLGSRIRPLAVPPESPSADPGSALIRALQLDNKVGILMEYFG